MIKKSQSPWNVNQSQTTVDVSMLKKFLSQNNIQDMDKLTVDKDQCRKRALSIFYNAFSTQKVKEQQSYEVNHQIIVSRYIIQLHKWAIISLRIRIIRWESINLLRRKMMIFSFKFVISQSTFNQDLILYICRYKKGRIQQRTEEVLIQLLQTHSLKNAKQYGVQFADLNEDLYQQKLQIDSPTIPDRQKRKLGHDRYDDFTSFDIYIRNKSNQALKIGCWTSNGLIQFKNIQLLQNTEQKQQGEHINQQYKGPLFYTLSKTFQRQLHDFLLRMGVFPQIALCVQYLSFNKDQRAYLRWLEKSYQYFKDQIKQLK